MKRELALLSFWLASPAAAQLVSRPVNVEPIPNAAPAQALVDRLIAEFPDLLDILLHVTPPGSLKNVVIAARLPKDLGEVSGTDDLGVERSGRPLVEIQKDGVRIGVLLQLRDAHHQAIGAVGIMAPWHDGDSQKAALDRAIVLRDYMARLISSRAALFG